MTTRYRIERELGRGAMGTVYRAFHVALKRPVAFKVIRADVAEPHWAERFAREKKILVSLDHPGVVKILDADECEEGPYLVMELIEGPSVADLIAGDPDGARRQAEALMLQLLDALGHVHERGLIHRDVKPENLMLTSEGTLKLVDFGLAAAGTPDRTMITDFDVAVGTPAYLAPELFEGAPSGPRSDVWAAGCVYYAMLAGKPPFHAPRLPELVTLVKEAPVPPLPSRNRELDRKRRLVLEQLLAKKPWDRPENGAEAAAVLRKHLDEEVREPLDFSGARVRTLVVPREPAAPREVTVGPRRASRAPSRAWQVTAAGLATAVLLALAWRPAREPRPVTPPASARPALTLDSALERFQVRSLLDEAVAALRDARASPGGIARPLATARARIESRVRAALQASELATALAGTPPRDPALSGTSTAGQRRYRALNDLAHLAGLFVNERIEPALPEPRGWPRDLGPLPDDLPPAVAGVTVGFDLADTTFSPYPVPGPTLNATPTLPLSLARGDAVTSLLVPRAWSPRAADRRYVHPEPLPLRAAAPDERVALSLVVRDLMSEEQIAVQLLTPGGEATDPVVISGVHHHRFRINHEIPASYLQHRSLALSYYRCSGSALDAACEVLAVSVVYLRR